MKYLAVLMLAMVVVVGCKKTETPSAQAGSSQQVSANVPADTNSTEQTTCPVMGGAIDKKVSTEYKGKKVYFCCPGCIAEFNKDPNKYIDKLPQFKTK